jgi:serine/threonine protein kinase
VRDEIWLAVVLRARARVSVCCVLYDSCDCLCRFKDMIDSCLQKEPSKRATAAKLLDHRFFKQV